MLDKVIQKIEEQQRGLDGSPAYFVGEHLKAILKSSSIKCCEIVLKDLDVKEMSISNCEKKIADYASKNRKCNTGFCPPDVAEGIIRKFYGIEDDHSTKTYNDLVDFSDFM